MMVSKNIGIYVMILGAIGLILSVVMFNHYEHIRYVRYGFGAIFFLGTIITPSYVGDESYGGKG